MPEAVTGQKRRPGLCLPLSCHRELSSRQTGEVRSLLRQPRSARPKKLGRALTDKTADRRKRRQANKSFQTEMAKLCLCEHEKQQHINGTCRVLMPPPPPKHELEPMQPLQWCQCKHYAKMSQTPKDKLFRRAERRANRLVNAQFQAEMANLAGTGVKPGIPVKGPTPGKAGKIAHKRTSREIGGLKSPVRKAKNERKRLVAKLDAVFSLYIRLRGKLSTGGICELCQKRPIEVCFHWVSRGDYATRWHPDNAVASCRGCNYEETFRKRKYRDIHIERVGEEAREALEAQARTQTHFSNSDLQEKIEEIKKLTTALGG